MALTISVSLPYALSGDNCVAMQEDGVEAQEMHLNRLLPSRVGCGPSRASSAGRRVSVLGITDDNELNADLDLNGCGGDVSPISSLVPSRVGSAGPTRTRASSAGRRVSVLGITDDDELDYGCGGEPSPIPSRVSSAGPTRSGVLSHGSSRVSSAGFTRKELVYGVPPPSRESRPGTASSSRSVVVSLPSPKARQAPPPHARAWSAPSRSASEPALSTAPEMSNTGPPLGSYMGWAASGLRSGPRSSSSSSSQQRSQQTNQQRRLAGKAHGVVASQQARRRPQTAFARLRTDLEQSTRSGIVCVGVGDKGGGEVRGDGGGGAPRAAPQYTSTSAGCSHELDHEISLARLRTRHCTGEGGDLEHDDSVSSRRNATSGAHRSAHRYAQLHGQADPRAHRFLSAAKRKEAEEARVAGSGYAGGAHGASVCGRSSAILRGGTGLGRVHPCKPAADSATYFQGVERSLPITHVPGNEDGGDGVCVWRVGGGVYLSEPICRSSGAPFFVASATSSLLRAHPKLH